MWNEITYYPKKALNFLNAANPNGPFTIGLTINSNQQLFFGTSVNPYMVQINENKKINPLIYAWTDQTIVYMEPEENKERDPSENKRLENIKDGLKLTSELQKEVIGHGNIGKIPTTLTFVEQMHKHGVVKGLWNAFVEVALCAEPKSRWW